VKLFDAHLHFFSWDLFHPLAAAAAAGGGRRPEELLEAAVRESGIELPDRDPVEHLQRWLTQLDQHGVDRAVTIASLPEEAEAVRAAHFDADDRLIPFTAVDPTVPGGAGFARRALRELGFRGIVLSPALHRFDLSDEACLAVIEEARDARAAVVIHCGALEIKVRDLFGLPRSYDPRRADPLGVIPAANRFPSTPFIIPHFGAGFFRETLMAGAQCPNVFVDTSGSNDWMATQAEDLDLEDAFARTLRVFGSTRVLFGTDSATFPRGWRSDIYCAQSAALERLGISIPERNRIFGENLSRILDLRP
jgi:uncharacterized protein